MRWTNSVALRPLACDTCCATAVWPHAHAWTDVFSCTSASRCVDKQGRLTKLPLSGARTVICWTSSHPVIFALSVLCGVVAFFFWAAPRTATQEVTHAQPSP